MFAFLTPSILENVIFCIFQTNSAENLFLSFLKKKNTGLIVNVFNYVYFSHHWELKKKFMEHHKDRFPEEALESRKFAHVSKKYWFIFQVGLAQTFGNMEFMGCQYPQVARSCLKLFRNANFVCLRRHRRESTS